MSAKESHNTESSENYLETVLLLGADGKKVRSVDIARERGFSKPTVSIALKKLVGKGYVDIGDDLSVSLTSEGRKIAEMIYERHRLITRMLVDIGVDEQTAAQDACRIEHDISEESFAKLKIFYESLKK